MRDPHPKTIAPKRPIGELPRKSRIIPTTTGDAIYLDGDLPQSFALLHAAAPIKTVGEWI